MIIYNITINIDQVVLEEVLTWLRQSHIERIISDKIADNCYILQILNTEENEGHTYCLHHELKDRQTLIRNLSEIEDKLINDLRNLFGEKVLTFSTILEKI
jgi:hypothetical protein